jgi:hypothetical protein
MKSIDKRLKRLESALKCSKCETEPCSCEEKYPPEKESFQAKISVLQHKARADRIESEMAKIHAHFREGLAQLESYFEICDYAVKYVESNARKVSLLLDAPVTSLFKKELCISFIDSIEPWTDNLIEFLVSKNYPKKTKKKLLK